MNIIIARNSQSANLHFGIRNSNDACGVDTTNNPIVQDIWLTVEATYTADDRTVRLTVGSNVVSLTCASDRTDRTLSMSYVGKSTDTVPNFNGLIAGLYAVDAVLTPAQIAALAASMHAGEDPQRDVCRACPAGQVPGADGACGLPVTPAPTAGCAAGYAPDAYGACAGCPAGTFKAAAGDAACANCTAGTASNATAATAACPACPPGQIQALGGQTACVDCPADTFRDAYAPATQLADCEACPDFSTSSAGSALETDCQCDAGYVDAAS